ncbi:hypothetical protein PVK06_044663 [Gossypium arboreum]|uniref:Uncharacterized protein n=1 Tax=Gossypium arboreum TaxID=29729 RepID=A0ABR0MTS4_GOSAR|nr:hypothetical protein PVK06_044663 [Gossypium arboreum]
MDMSFDLQPLLEYIQWYSSMGKPYLLGGQSTVVPSHVQRLGVYQLVADIEAEPEPNPEPKLEPELESERSHSHSADSYYHPNFPGNDYFSGSSRGRYHYGFDIFGSYPPQYSTSSGPYQLQYSTSLGLYPPQYSTTPGLYPPQYSTPPGLYPPQHDTLPDSSSSMSFKPYNFSSMSQTPSLATKEDVGHRNHL